MLTIFFLLSWFSIQFNLIKIYNKVMMVLIYVFIIWVHMDYEIRNRGRCPHKGHDCSSGTVDWGVLLPVAVAVGRPRAFMWASISPTTFVHHHHHHPPTSNTFVPLSLSLFLSISLSLSWASNIMSKSSFPNYRPASYLTIISLPFSYYM